ncbi:hypothetical protein [Sandaracinus amylolyticus]|uniref:Uncharacterized protein n=1 Tax=Sandaracinus amylolyticus TaxID=927083 RepID=A0A0F6VYL5_9BACT|nr:hypothetical protein [Sandaracinus amylolyticus]AKF02917.1 hypothetical protein DB32_000065 [Sandaracinus amylolyticus]
MSSEAAIRIVVLSLGALLALASLARVRRVEAAHESRWSARVDLRRPRIGDGYRASRATMWIARGVPQLLRRGAALGTIAAVLDVLAIALAPVVALEALAPRGPRALGAMLVLVPATIAGALGARALFRDGERLARCDPEELEPRAGLEGRWLHFGTMLLLALLGLAYDGLLAILATTAIVLSGFERHVIRESWRRVRDADRASHVPSRALRA